MSTVAQWSFELKVLNHNSQQSIVCVLYQILCTLQPLMSNSLQMHFNIMQ